MRRIKLIIVILLIFALTTLAEISSENWELFREVFSLVKNTYVEEKSTEEIMRGAFVGLALATGPESGYLKGSKVQEYENALNLPYQLPLYFTKDEGYARVISTFGKELEGIEIGDYLRAIDGKGIFDMSYLDLITLIKSKEEKEMNCQFIKKGSLKILEKKLKTVPFIGLQITPFKDQKRVLKLVNLEATIDLKLKEEIEKIDTPIILDLRGCASDNIDRAIAWASFLFGKGEIYYSSKKGKVPITFEGDGVLQNKKCAILVDKSTARGGEVVAIAGSMKFPLCGEQTFGFPSIHKKIALKNGDLLVINAGYFFDKSGLELKEKSLKLDYVIAKMGEKSDENIFSEIFEQVKF